MSLKPAGWRQGARAFLLAALARLFLSLGMCRAATACWCAILRAERGNLGALAGLAYARAAQGRLAAALRWQQRLVYLNPKQARAWYNLGFLQEQLLRLDAASMAFARAVEIEPALDTAWYGLGSCLRRLGRTQEALQALDRNTTLQPWSPHGYIEKAHALASLGQWSEVGELIQHLERFEPRVAADLAQQYRPSLAVVGLWAG